MTYTRRSLCLKYSALTESSKVYHRAFSYLMQPSISKTTPPLSHVQTLKRLYSTFMHASEGHVLGRWRFNLKKFLTNSRELQKPIDNAAGIEHVESDAPQLSYSDETLCQGNAWDYANQGIRWAQNNSRSTMEHQQWLCSSSWNILFATYQKESFQSHWQILRPLGHLSRSRLRSCSRSSVQPSSTGTVAYWSSSGRTYVNLAYIISKKRL